MRFSYSNNHTSSNDREKSITLVSSGDLVIGYQLTHGLTLYKNKNMS